MNRRRRSRHRLRWCQYMNRAHRLHAHAGHMGMFKAMRPFYRNGARLPWGWQPREGSSACPCDVQMEVEF